MSSRYLHTGNSENVSPAGALLGTRDILRAMGAKLVVTCSDSLEMIPGSAAIQGMARAMKKIVLYDYKVTDITGDNGYRTSRNLMIDCSADVKVSKFSSIVPTVLDLLVTDSTI